MSTQPWLGVAGTGMPGSVTELDAAHLRQPQATPVAAARQARLVLAAKLIGQRLLFAARMTKDDRAKLATVTSIRANDLFSTGHCLMEQVVNSTRHQNLAFDRAGRAEMMRYVHCAGYKRL